MTLSETVFSIGWTGRASPDVLKLEAGFTKGMEAPEFDGARQT
jgi:hypothetical protein